MSHDMREGPKTLNMLVVLYLRAWTICFKMCMAHAAALGAPPVPRHRPPLLLTKNANRKKAPGELHRANVAREVAISWTRWKTTTRGEVSSMMLLTVNPVQPQGAARAHALACSMRD